jgi:hypothetical protein
MTPKARRHERLLGCYSSSSAPRLSVFHAEHGIARRQFGAILTRIGPFRGAGIAARAMLNARTQRAGSAKTTTPRNLRRAPALASRATLSNAENVASSGSQR